MSEWTDDEIRILREMHEKGHSASTIGVEIGRSRNAIIGKLHRLGAAGSSVEVPQGTLDEIAKLWRQGLNATEISGRIGYTSRRVGHLVNWLRSRGVDMPRRGCGGRTRPKGRKQKSQKRPTIQFNPKDGQIEWEGADNDRQVALIDMWNAGHTQAEIARALYVDENVVNVRICNLKARGVNLRNGARAKKPDQPLDVDFDSVPKPPEVRNIPFMERRIHFECAWITSPDGTPIDSMTVCGCEITQSRREFCDYHMTISEGVGSRAETKALHDLKQMARREAA